MSRAAAIIASMATPHLTRIVANGSYEWVSGYVGFGLQPFGSTFDGQFFVSRRNSEVWSFVEVRARYTFFDNGGTFTIFGAAPPAINVWTGWVSMTNANLTIAALSTSVYTYADIDVEIRDKRDLRVISKTGYQVAAEVSQP
jgi:hypothetical protein